MGFYPDIRRVEQLHGTGCAVACVAMVTGASYTKAALHVKGKRTGDLSAYFSEMARGIRALGFTCRMGPDFREKKCPGILMFEWWTTGDFHCVVYDPRFGGRFVDPGYDRTLGPDFYLEHWRRNGRESLIVTGRKS